MLGAKAVSARDGLIGTGAVLDPRVEVDEAPSRANRGPQSEPSRHPLKLPGRVEIVPQGADLLQDQHPQRRRQESDHQQQDLGGRLRCGGRQKAVT